MAETVETAVYRLRVEGQEEIDRAKRSVEGLATAEDKLASANRNTSATMQRSIAQLDPLIAAQEKYLRALKSVDNARVRGVSESQLATRLALEEKAYNAATVAAEHYRRAQANAQLTPAKSAQDSAFAFEAAGAQKYQAALAGVASSSKVSRYELINLSRQVQDVGVSLFSGQGLFTVLVQQGSQIFDVFASSKTSVSEFFSSGVAWAGRFLTPMNLAIGAVVSFGAAAIYSAAQFATAQKDIERSLLGIGAQSGATAEKINAFAQIGPRESIAGMSPGERREAGTEFARTGAIDVSKLNGVKEALQGYAIIAGKDATDATKDLAKALGGDLVKAVAELEKTYGALDPKLKDTVQNFLVLGERAKAQQAIIDAVAAANTRALDTITPLAAGWNGLVNILSMVAEGYGKILSYKVFETAGQEAERVAKATAAAAAAAQQMQNLTIGKGVKVTQDYVPEIEQVNKLTLALADLVRAKEAAAAAGKTFDDGGAEQKIRNTIAATNDAKAASIAWQQTIAQVSAEWQGVSQSAATALHAQEGQLSVINAIGGAAKMAAQYALDYQTTWEKTHNAVEAAATAMMNLQTAQAQVNAQAKETLWSLENQARAVAAVTAAEQMQAQATATRNELLRQGVDFITAQSIAMQQLANAQAAANASVEQQIRSLQDQTEMIEARRTGTEATVEAAQAYRKAIDSGASSTKAAALQAAVLEKNMAETASTTKTVNGNIDDMGTYTGMWKQHISAANVSLGDSVSLTNQLVDAMGNVVNRALQLPDALGQFNLAGGTLASAIAGQGEKFIPAGQQDMSHSAFEPSIMPKGPLTYEANPLYPVSYKGGGTGKRLDTGVLMNPADFYLDPDTYQMKYEVGYGARKIAEDKAEALATTEDSYEKAIAVARAARDPGAELAALQNQLGYVKGLEPSTENYRQIASLQDAIDSLTKSTDTLNSTNTRTNELLSPYYTQDPRTSHIGFRSQGMANGGYVDVPGGASANDNMLAMIPVASGERIYVDPMTNRRGTGSGGMTINISSPITINGNANPDQLGRTLYQSNQALAKQVRTATQ